MTELLLDLDGTVYLSGQVLPDVWAQLDRVSKCGVGINYMTNNTSVSLQQYEVKLREKNLVWENTKILSPSAVFLDWIENNQISDFYTVGTAALIDEFNLCEGLNSMSNHPQCVVVGFDRELTYQKLMRACELINSGIPWYQTHIDISCPTQNGPIPDCGAIANLIEQTTGISSSGHFGKPGPNMIKYIEKTFGKTSELVVVGDRVYTDGAIGLSLGARSVIVCTGEYSQQSGDKISNRLEVFESLAEFLKSNY